MIFNMRLDRIRGGDATAAQILSRKHHAKGAKSAKEQTFFLTAKITNIAKEMS